MNVEEITKKLEEIRADAFDRASSHDEKSQAQLEDVNRVELDEDVAGEDVKLERTKGKDFKGSHDLRLGRYRLNRLCRLS